MGYSCRTLLRDTLVRHSSGTLFKDIVGLSSSFPDTPRTKVVLQGRQFSAFWDTLVGHSCRTLLWVTLVGHSCRTVLWDTLLGHSCRTLL